MQNEFHSLDINCYTYLELYPSEIEFIFLADELNAPQEVYLVKALITWVIYNEKRRVDFVLENFAVLLRLSMVSTRNGFTNSSHA